MTNFFIAVGIFLFTIAIVLYAAIPEYIKYEYKEPIRVMHYFFSGACISFVLALISAWIGTII